MEAGGNRTRMGISVRDDEFDLALFDAESLWVCLV